jgi:hypothetical protein
MEIGALGGKFIVIKNYSVLIDIIKMKILKRFGIKQVIVICVG